MAKTKALISLAVTAKLICVFVFAYAKSRFSLDAAHKIGTVQPHYKTPLTIANFDITQPCLACYNIVITILS